MEGNKNKILVITGGHIDESFLNKCVIEENYTLIIVVDHGLVAADHLKLPLDFIVGDFDSVPHNILNQYRNSSVSIKTYPAEKDKTDTEIAIELALMNNPESIDIIGATGSRLDHVFANIHLLLMPMELQVAAFIIDPNNKIYLRKDDFVLQKAKQYGNYVSLMPFSGQVSGLTMIGFKYPLNKILLAPGSSLCVSNVLKAEEGKIEFTEGILVVFETRD